MFIVVPHVGTWIEISLTEYQQEIIRSFPTWERGLKWRSGHGYRKKTESFPTWERGLKYVKHQEVMLIELSFPTWERGLKS